jgi:hypothetical protein
MAQVVSCIYALTDSVSLHLRQDSSFLKHVGPMQRLQCPISSAPVTGHGLRRRLCCTLSCVSALAPCPSLVDHGPEDTVVPKQARLLSSIAQAHKSCLRAAAVLSNTVRCTHWYIMSWEGQLCLYFRNTTAYTPNLVHVVHRLGVHCLPAHVQIGLVGLRVQLKKTAFVRQAPEAACSGTR